MFGFFKKDKAVEVEVPTQVPAHIGIIMDGNGRWAKKRMQPRVFGHKAGMEALQTVTKAANKLGVKVITVYAFSTENWTRPDQEVKFIMNLPVEFYDNYVPELHANNVKIQMIGETDRLPKQTFEALTKAGELTKNNTGLILNFALNYGGRAEITQALKLISQDVLDAKINPGDITEELIGNYLFTQHLPKDLRDPDSILRTPCGLILTRRPCRKPFLPTIVVIVDLEGFRRKYDTRFTEKNLVCRDCPGYFPTNFNDWWTLASDSNWNHSHASHA